MCSRIESSLASRFPTGSYLGVEYEGRFRLCTISQVKVNDAGGTNIPALREALERELREVRDDQGSVQLGRRGAGEAAMRSEPADSTTSARSVSARGSNDMNAMDLELMMAVLPEPTSYRLDADTEAKMRMEAEDDFCIATMSSVSILLTNQALRGTGGLGAGFLRPVSGVDYFHPSVRPHTKACWRSYIVVLGSPALRHIVNLFVLFKKRPSRWRPFH